MATKSITKKGLHLIAGCSLALLIAAGGGPALAHGSGGAGPGGLGKVHGPGSSHDPIIAPTTVVRDHRGHSHSPVVPPGSVVRDHRPHHPTPRHGCRDGYWKNCAWGSVRDHRN